MAFKDIYCSCDEYCRCVRQVPCACAVMLKDPHCELCLQHLSPGQERVWREDMLAHGIDTNDWEKWDDEHPSDHDDEVWDDDGGQ